MSVSPSVYGDRDRLHFEDIRHLLRVLQALVEKGNTVLVIEHNTDVMKVADHVIDLGPDGGEAGGHLLFAGTPEQLAETDTPTAAFVAEELARSADAHGGDGSASLTTGSAAVDLDDLTGDDEPEEDEVEEEPEEEGEAVA